MQKNVIIDRLRGFSVLVVICMHYSFFFPSVLAPLMTLTLWNGYYGVTAFFCTSGFLITTTMLRRYDEVAKVDLYAFYVMRFGRIVPPLLLLCLALWLLNKTAIPFFAYPTPLTLKDTLLSIVELRYNHYYQHGGAQMYVWAVLWSLSIEEVFYLVYPLTAKVVRRAWVLVVVMLAVIVDASLHRRGSINTIYDYFGCFDGIAFGVLSALAARRFSRRVNCPTAWLLLAAGLATVLGIYAALDVHVHYNLGLTLIALGTAFILFGSQCAPFATTRPLPYDLLAYCGRLSYEIYLFHMTVYAVLTSIISPTYPWLVFAVVLLCVVVVSDAIARFYAEPLNRWLRWLLLPARTPLATTDGVRATV